MKLKLLPGLKWKGHLTIIATDRTGYVVKFTAEIVDPRVEFRHVYDQTTLSAMQLFDWTGYREESDTMSRGSGSHCTRQH